MRPCTGLFFAAIAGALAAFPAVAQKVPAGSPKDVPAADGSGPSGKPAPLPGPPAFVSGAGGDRSVDPSPTSAIWDTDARNPTPGKEQRVKCPGGQVFTQAQGNVSRADCR